SILARLPTTNATIDKPQSRQNRILSEGPEGYESCITSLVAIVSPLQGNTFFFCGYFCGFRMCAGLSVDFWLWVVEGVKFLQPGRT
ncbi:MAG: hypothetical protein AAGC93_07235, partial [Cyanobacteria bacterium P01_F01_bin.53]